MAGIYLHIPFCRSKCPYCNFFSQASLKHEEEFTAALLKEIGLQKHYLEGQKISTVYFGGGSPSVLKPSAIHALLQSIEKTHGLEELPEITMEANPDDVSAGNLDEWKSAGINRLSIGIQSFDDGDLRYLGRKHDGRTAETAMKTSLEKGFTNLSVDFIYGMPTLSDETFASNIGMALSAGVPHISAYALTTEPGTAMDVLIRKKKMQGPDEERTVRQFLFLMDRLEESGFEHYEISNFCLPGFPSRHNSAYWEGTPYLGLGPSAHSFNGVSRQWNISSVGDYIKQVNLGEVPAEKEVLSSSQRFNEYIMTSIRTKSGVDPHLLSTRFGKDLADDFSRRAGDFIASGHLVLEHGAYHLTRKGKLFADAVSSELFIDIP